MGEIRVTREYYDKKPGTKTAWELRQTQHQVFNKEMYENFVNAKSFFRSLGGGEYHEKNYTGYGYLVTRVISTSPDKQQRRITYFDFGDQS